MWRRILPLLAIGVLRCSAQTPDSHEVNADHSITFRYVNSGAKSVVVDTDAAAAKLPMHRDASGVRVAQTSAHLRPEHYGYQLIVDGVPQLDPLNRDTRYNLYGLYDDVLVPGTPPMPWELTNVAHGSVTQKIFSSRTALHLPAAQERMLVYTPPGYDAHKPGGYPVLYLLHGWSQTETDWTRIGQANLILDAEIAKGEAVPMIVVMPLLYGDYEVAISGPAVWKDKEKVARNQALATELLLRDVVPAVEREYNVAKGRDVRAVAGLSMGGLQSLQIGLGHSDQFGWVGAFSPALTEDTTGAMADLEQKRVRLLWVSCGTEDGLAGATRDFVAAARAKGMAVTAMEMPGKHNWLVWRESLLEFVPLLFRK